MTQTNRKKNDVGGLMIGAKLYQKKSKVIVFLLLYAVLALIGLGLIIFSISRDRNPTGAEGFTVIFGAGMAFLTWSKSRKPRIVVGEEYLEVRQQNRPEFIKYKNISTITCTKDNRLLIGTREGHGLKQSAVLLKDLEDADAERLVDFCRNKRWKGSMWL